MKPIAVPIPSNILLCIG